MFKHRGKRRTYAHNLKLASILSSVAGIVNITGVLEFKILTTNVTGHFAYFSEELVFGYFKKAYVFLFYILFFLLGAFVSGFFIELMSRAYKESRLSYVLPVSVEIGVMCALVISSHIFIQYDSLYHVPFTLALLFTMGLQNALVTKVSGSVVRTTHLTGLFTDLGIELSQLLFSKETAEKKQLHRGISLKLAIILCFFGGGVIGGVSYSFFKLNTLLIPILLLLFSLWYDGLLFRFYHLKRKFRDHRL